jgi:Tol biopolymer transport system component
VRDNGIVELTFPRQDEEMLVLTTSDAVALEPALSPDGKRIAYTRQLVSAVIPGQETDLGSDIYVADAGGSDPRIAVQHAERGDLLRSPAWVSNDELLVSMQRFDAGTFTANAVRVNIDTNEQTVVLPNAIFLDVSPDGSQIAFVQVDELFNQSLWVTNIDGTGARELAGLNDNFGTISSPRFSADGATIAFGAAAPLAPAVSLGAPLHNGLPADIWTVAVESAVLEPIIELQLDSPSLAWSGDGARLFVFAGDGLFVVDPVAKTSNRIGDGTYHGQIDWVGTD